MNELFIIPPEALLASEEAIESTANDLRTLGLYNLPYPKVDIQVITRLATERPSVILARPGGYDPNNYVIARFIGCRTDGTHESLELEAHNGNSSKIFHDCDPPDKARTACAALTKYLIVLLATRNTIKTTTVNKLARLGIGTRKGGIKAYPRVTTISIPKDLEDDPEHPPTGATKAPHLRRGHIRGRQHYGPGNKFTRAVWIAPIFVNADPDFVSSRKAYNVNLGG